MNPLLKSAAMNVLALGKAYPTRLTPTRDVHSLIESLAPRYSGKELIRFGPARDGGYLVPDDFDGIESCFSPGVNLISGFEKDCAERGIEVFLADRSVENPAESHERFHFTRKYVGVTTNEDFMTMDDWVASSLTGPGTTADLMLQIDIEGYEYETFLAMSDGLMGRFRIIVAEFHDLDQLWNLPFFRIASRTFEKILQTHTCVHIHPNNHIPLLTRDGLAIPPATEFTFLRHDRIDLGRHAPFVTLFPHQLDTDNSAGLPPVALPKCWHR